jgi:threonylcarbamoyladenosine tRNA methylthiotransferase MtaB
MTSESTNKKGEGGAIVKKEEQIKVVTFGCRLNTYESERIKQQIKHIDDVIVVNTCAVTAEAERQARQAIRKLHKENPEKRIIVTGCSATLNKSAYETMPQVYAVVTNQEKEYIQLVLKNMKNPDFLPVFNANVEKLELLGFEGRARAFLQIQTGCDHCCSFCVVRKARGPSKSFSISQIVEQAIAFARQGYLEINLTGVNITSFNSEGYTLGMLIQLLLSKLPKNVRIRLSSLDPADIGDDLLNVLRNNRVLPHLHLSLQSGDDFVLKKMLRRHTSESAACAIAKVREIRPDIVLGCDIICGFPTETDEMFEETCRFVERNNIPLLHVFPYSDRPGTVAQSLLPKVTKVVKKNRARRLRGIGRGLLEKTMEAWVGAQVNMLVEKEEKGAFWGKTDHFLPIYVKNGQGAEGLYSSAVWGVGSVGQVIPVVVKKVEEDGGALILGAIPNHKKIW